MRLCFITKYPPIQGGVSMRCYWMARELARRGHQISVVTNAHEVEPEYRIRLTSEDETWYEPTFNETGGRVEVHNTCMVTDRIHHIPFSNPYVTKLASLATDHIRRHKADAIFAYYLQPYGLAAYLASQWTGTPYIVRHAGSDLGRLMKEPELRTAYLEVLRRADCVCTGADQERFIAMGVRSDRIWSQRGFPLPDTFSPSAKPLDIGALVRELTEQGGSAPGSFLNSRPLIDAPTIGIYGKVGVTKGSFDLLRALAEVKRRGSTFNFVAVTQGQALREFVSLLEELDLQNVTWVLPFLPHWRMPAFVRACTAVCFLERDFPISFHGPTVPREILACGTCLIVSREIADKQRFRESAVSGQHQLVVEDPRNTPVLADIISEVVREPEKAARIGANGWKLFTASETSRWDDLLDAFEARVGMAQAGDRRAGTADDEPRDVRLRERLPLTHIALGEAWHSVVGRYCADLPYDGSTLEDAIQCVRFIANEFGELKAKPWLSDVLKYELAHNRLYQLSDELAQTEAGLLKQEAPLLSSRVVREIFTRGRWHELKACRPMVRPGVFVETFECDISELWVRLHRGESVEHCGARTTRLLFVPAPNFCGEEFTISDSTLELITACTGQLTLGEVLGAILVGTDNATHVCTDDAEVVDMVRRLWMKGVLQFARGTSTELKDPDAASVRVVTT